MSPNFNQSVTVQSSLHFLTPISSLDRLKPFSTICAFSIFLIPHSEMFTDLGVEHCEARSLPCHVVCYIVTPYFTVIMVLEQLSSPFFDQVVQSVLWHSRINFDSTIMLYKAVEGALLLMNI